MCQNHSETGVNSFIDSPNIPSNYGNNQDCSMIRTFPLGKHVNLQSESFATESGFDWLKVKDTENNKTQS